MSELDQDNIVIDTDSQDDVDTTNQDMPDSFEYDEVVKMKGSLDKATSKYVIPWKELLQKYGVKSFSELEQKLSQEKENFVTKDTLELERFLDRNSDLSDKRDDLLETAKALQSLPKNKDKTLREVLELASKTLKVEEEHQVNQEKLKKSRVSDGDWFSESNSYSRNELEKLATTNPDGYAKAIDRIEKGKAKFVN